MVCCFQVEELANLSLNQPVRLFVDNNTDVAYNLRQEFVRIRNNRENDRLAIVTGGCCFFCVELDWNSSAIEKVLRWLSLTRGSDKRTRKVLYVVLYMFLPYSFTITVKGEQTAKRDLNCSPWNALKLFTLTR